MLNGPLADSGQRLLERLAERGQCVLDVPRSRLLQHPAFDQPVGLHPAERVGEHLLTDSGHPASQVGMALGPVLGGLIYDTFSSYAWLFIGAFSLGIGAFLAALAFTRLPRRQMMAAAA